MTTHSSKSTNRARYLKQRAHSQSIITGPGLFFTCIRGKERPASSELINLLQSIADELDSTLTSETQLEIQEEEEEEEEDEEDIETLIAKELNQIKSKVPHQSLAHRFNSKPMDCECLGFIQFPKDRDPVKFINFLVDQVQIGRTGFGLRYTQRVTPVSATSSSANLMGFKELVTKTLEPHFGIKVSDSNVTSNHLNSSTHPLLRSGLQYRIEPIIRCHDQPLNRAEVINVIGKIVDEFNSDEFIGLPPSTIISSSPQPDPRLSLKHKVNLNHAEVVILVSVYRYVVGISVVHDYDQQRKRFNLQAIAEAREKTQI